MHKYRRRPWCWSSPNYVDIVMTVPPLSRVEARPRGVPCVGPGLSQQLSTFGRRSCSARTYDELDTRNAHANVINSMIGVSIKSHDHEFRQKNKIWPFPTASAFKSRKLQSVLGLSRLKLVPDFDPIAAVPSALGF